MIANNENKQIEVINIYATLTTSEQEHTTAQTSFFLMDKQFSQVKR